jgi:hypothetical protein
VGCFKLAMQLPCLRQMAQRRSFEGEDDLHVDGFVRRSGRIR